MIVAVKLAMGVVAVHGSQATIRSPWILQAMAFVYHTLETVWFSEMQYWWCTQAQISCVVKVFVQRIM